MKIRHLLVVAAAAVAVADVSAFDCHLVIQQPNPNIDITQAFQLETMRIAADKGLATTEVMPKYVDEDSGHEIIGSLDASSNPSWGEYNYAFKLADFKANGEYKIVLPEGMLKNAAGELSDEKTFKYTVEIPELAAAMFDDFKVLSISPDFSKAQAIWDEQVVKINTNHNDAIGFTQLQITDNTTGESVMISNNFTVGRNLGNSSEISWTVAGSFKFYEEHQYTAEFVFYNGPDQYSKDGFPTPVVARQTYEFTGKVEGYKYSQLTLLSIDPTPLTLPISSPSQAVFTYTFSGPVNVYKAETPMGQFGTTVYPESCLSSNEDKTVWTLNLSDNDYVKSVDAELVIYIYARDLEGYQLRGNFGEEENACYEGIWTCDIGAKGITVVTPQNGETLDALTEIVVKSESGDEMSYNWNEITIQDLVGNILGSVVYDGDGAAAKEFHFNKWIPADSWESEPLNIVAEGSYVIYFSTGCFVFGEEFSSVNSRSLYSGFQITGILDEPAGPGVDPADQETLKLVEANPADGSTVESLASIRLKFSEPVGLNEPIVKVYNAAEEVVATGYGDYDYDDWDAVDVIIVYLNDPITVDGVYEVVIPARSIITNDYEEGKAGACNPEIRLTYTIGEGNAVNTVTTSEACNVYDVQGRLVLRKASAADIKTLEKGIYVAGGKKFVVK